MHLYSGKLLFSDFRNTRNVAASPRRLGMVFILPLVSDLDGGTANCIKKVQHAFSGEWLMIYHDICNLSKLFNFLEPPDTHI